MKRVIIRPVKTNDLHDIAVLHKKRFSDHFLGKYSVRVIKAYYREFVGECVFLVGERVEKINRFVMGGDSIKLNNAKVAFLKKTLYYIPSIH